MLALKSGVAAVEQSRRAGGLDGCPSLDGWVWDPWVGLQSRDPPFMGPVGGQIRWEMNDDELFSGNAPLTVSLLHRPHSFVLFRCATWPVPLWVWSFKCGQGQTSPDANTPIGCPFHSPGEWQADWDCVVPPGAALHWATPRVLTVLLLVTKINSSLSLANTQPTLSSSWEQWQ